MPPRLRNDCFALPAGVDWVPLDEALARLRARVTTVVPVEQVALADSRGRVLAQDLMALRANPRPQIRRWMATGSPGRRWINW